MNTYDALSHCVRWTISSTVNHCLLTPYCTDVLVIFLWTKSIGHIVTASAEINSAKSLSAYACQNKCGKVSRWRFSSLLNKSYGRHHYVCGKPHHVFADGVVPCLCVVGHGMVFYRQILCNIRHEIIILANKLILIPTRCPMCI